MSIFAARESITTHSIHHQLLFKGLTVQKGDVVKRFLFFICDKSTKFFRKMFCSSKSIRIFAMSIRD
jgi:hypothetical protein